MATKATRRVIVVFPKYAVSILGGLFQYAGGENGDHMSKREKCCRQEHQAGTPGLQPKTRKEIPGLNRGGRDGLYQFSANDAAAAWCIICICGGFFACRCVVWINI